MRLPESLTALWNTLEPKRSLAMVRLPEEEGRFFLSDLTVWRSNGGPPNARALTLCQIASSQRGRRNGRAKGRIESENFGRLR